MWLLYFVPDSLIQLVVHAILATGIVGCILSFFIVNKILRFFPPFAGFVSIAQLISALLLIAGIYFEGGYTTEMQWRNRVKEIEAKVAQAEQESKEANSKLDKKSAERVKIIQGRQLVVKQYIDREITKYDASCAIPIEVVRAHNAAAKNEDLK
jgi:hypothetical protein